MTACEFELSLELLDRLARLDPAREALHQEIALDLAGEPAEVRRAYCRLRRLMDELGLALME